MSPEELLQKAGAPQAIERIHQVITEKFPIDSFRFDAWYTNRPFVFSRLGKIGQAMAKTIREEVGIPWRKDVAEPLRSLLEDKNAAPRSWEDGPDGALAGLAIILVGWIANQAAQKSRDNRNDKAIELFEKCLRPLLLASMDLGVKTAEGRRST